MGSLTMFGAIELQVLLRTFDVLGVSLILMWALSPLGGQASLRLLETASQSVMTNQTLNYLDSDSMSLLGQGADTFESAGFILNALYLSALLTPPAGQAASMDTWGNIKVPIIETLEQAGKSEIDGWFPTTDNTSYSSLVGLPIDGIPTSGSSYFTVESYYMKASCTNVSSSNLYIGDGGFIVNITDVPTKNNPLLPNQPSYPDVKPLNVTFASASIASDFTFMAQCVLTRSSVESNVTCDRRSCGVIRVRRSRFDERPPGYTPFSFGIAASLLSMYWPQSANSVHHPDYSTPTEYFLSDPTLKDISTSENRGGVSLVGMPADVFSQRFSLLLNTYWQCSLAPWYQTGNFPSNTSLLSGLDNEQGVFNTTIAAVTNDHDIYICNTTWATLLLVASSVLLILGLYGAIVKHRTRGPQVLGYVSSMTRDNPYVNLPPGGCALDGLARARLLKDVTVQLRDVTPRHEVGHIALSDANPFDRNERFAFGRLYADPTYRVAPW